MRLTYAAGAHRPIAPILGAAFRFRTLNADDGVLSIHGHRCRVIDRVVSITLPLLPSCVPARQSAVPSITVRL